MKLLKRLIWESNNGKYRVVVRRFEADYIDIDVLHSKIDQYGRMQPIRYKDLPRYVVDKINELKEQIK